MATHAIEHKEGHWARWLRERRYRLALGIAVVEGVLVLVGVVPAWLALLVGAALVGYWWLAGRHHTRALPRQASWTAALSQVFVALVPLLAFAFVTLAVVALVVLALVALVALLGDRR